MPETVLITGASGFIGNRLAAGMLKLGRRVICLAREGSDCSRLERAGALIRRGRLEDTESLKRAVEGADTIHHLAALVRPRALILRTGRLLADLDAINVKGALELAKLAAAGGSERFIFYSSIAAMGPGLDLDEDSPCRPVTAYGKSKLAAERALLAMEKGSLKLSIIRPAMVYGPGAPVWGGLFRAAKILPILPLPGNGGNLWSLCYIDNLLEAALTVEEHAANGHIYIAADLSLELRRLLELISSAAASRPCLLAVNSALTALAAGAAGRLQDVSGLRLNLLDFITDQSKYYEAVSDWRHPALKLRSLGWRPRISAEEGLANAAAWYSSEGII